MKTFDQITLEENPVLEQENYSDQAAREQQNSNNDPMICKSMDLSICGRTYKKSIINNILVIFGTVGLTLLFFLVLPLMQTISKSPQMDMVVQGIDTVNVPPPPPPPEKEIEEEKKPEEKPPELAEKAQPLDLSQLELALNPNLGFSDSGMGGDFSIKLNTASEQSDDFDALFSMADLDQKPRIIYQPSPILNAMLRKKAPGTAYIVFIVDKNGRVQQPIVQKATDSVFETPALAAIKQWKFEPGKRNGQAVRFRMRVPITFPKG